jgi:PAS domain S-box-containing protein
MPRPALQLTVVIAYVVAAFVGFKLAFVAEQVTTVWAPTGIAIAALLLGGVRLWPAVWSGALLANLATAAPVWTAFVVATGNALEAIVAVWWLRKLPQFDAGLRRIADVAAFILIAAVTCTAISATVGVSTLCAAGVQPWNRFAVLWFDWWLGDALGAAVVAPAILTAFTHAWSKAESARAAGWVAAALLITHIVFGQVIGASPHPLEYAVFPLAIAAAVTGGPALTVFVVLTASVVAIWHTVHGAGPFASGEVHYSLILLQTFMGVLAATSLVLAASVAERRSTEQRERQTAAGLRRRQELLRLAQRAGGVATFEWDFRNQIAQCSAEFFTLFGLGSEDGVMTGAEWGRFVHPDDRERMAAHLARVVEGREAAAADYRIICADGSTRWLSYAGQITRTEHGDRLLGTVVDITARVGADAALRENRDVLALAMRSGSMGAWSRNLVTNAVWWSRELEEIFGLQSGDFSRTEAGFFAFVHPDDRQSVRSAVDQAVEHRSDYVVEFRFQHSSGEWRWMEGRGRAVYADDGTPTTLYGIGIDVTERKRAEIALREAKQAAESANQLKDHFLATLSHELRTPLNAILGYARMLQTNSIAPEKRQRAIEVIARNAVAQNQLVEDLLDMSRITTGKVRLDPVPVPAITVLREAVDGIKPAADAKRIALAIDADPFAGSVRADSTRLQQVFWNVLTNAVKFTGDGGTVNVLLRRTGPNVEIVVSDTGAGISSDFLPFVFEPFRQGDNRFDRVYGGLGLGLTITKQLVELHGGTIAAASAGPGQGATFTITLPCVEGQHVAPAETRERSRPLR